MDGVLDKQVEKLDESRIPEKGLGLAISTYESLAYRKY